MCTVHTDCTVVYRRSPYLSTTFIPASLSFCIVSLSCSLKQQRAAAICNVFDQSLMTRWSKAITWQILQLLSSQGQNTYIIENTQLLLLHMIKRSVMANASLILLDTRNRSIIANTQLLLLSIIKRSIMTNTQLSYLT